MKKLARGVLATLIVTMVMGCQTSPIDTKAGANTTAPKHEDAVALVKQAATAYRQDKNKFVSELQQKNGPYHKGELYVFAYDMKGTVVGNPAKPELVGVNQYDNPDVDGKKFRKEIVDNAKAGKSGWVKYRTKNPVTGAIENKVVFYEPADDIIVAAGTFANY